MWMARWLERAGGFILVCGMRLDGLTSAGFI
jgi:hypothetical protein